MFEDCLSLLLDLDLLFFFLSFLDEVLEFAFELVFEVVDKSFVDVVLAKWFNEVEF